MNLPQNPTSLLFRLQSIFDSLLFQANSLEDGRIVIHNCFKILVSLALCELSQKIPKNASVHITKTLIILSV